MLRRLFRIAAWSAGSRSPRSWLSGLLYGVVTPVSTLMLARWATGQPVERVAVPLDAVSSHVARAIIASEDARFCQHRGVDWDAIRLVIDDEDGPARGASTIAMQVSKNLFLWPSRSYIP
jgi:monofunctional biosynthetic peptidoglycan transglycosylase